MPSVIPSSLDLTDKDFDAAFARFRNLIRSVFPTWTEESVANFGNIMVGLKAHGVDVVAYYADKWLRESRIATAELRRSLLGLVKLIGYTPEGASAAQATITATFAAAPSGFDFTAGTTCRTAEVTDPVKFQILTTTSVLAGSTSATFVVENSEDQEDVFTSTGTPSQEFTLARTPFIPGSEAVTAGDGAYTRVDNFLDSDNTERHYRVIVDEQDRATIKFGNAVSGTIPNGTITVTYKTGGGAAANVEAGTIRVIEGTYPTPITITNASAASGGQNRQTNAQIKEQAPRSLRVLNRAIAREDYELVAETVAGVARSLSLFRDQEPAVQENEAFLFVVPEGGGTATQTLLDEVESRFTEKTGFDDPSHPKPPTLVLHVQTAPYQSIDVTVTAYRSSGTTGASMKAAIEAALEEFFGVTITASRLLEIAPKIAAANGVTEQDGDALVRNPLIDFGYNFKDADGNPTGELAWTDVLNIIRDLSEVRKVAAGDGGLLLSGATSDVAIGNFNFPTLGDVVVVDGDTGLQL